MMAAACAPARVEQARVLRHAPGDEADADARVARRVELALSQSSLP
jgi:hypothetical protein